MPTQECVKQWLRRPDGLLPVVWQSLEKGKVVMSVARDGGSDAYVSTEPEAVKALHAGLIYWGIDQMSKKYTNTQSVQGDLLPAVYADYSSIPQTNDRYLEQYLRVCPSKDVPHPEQRLLKVVRDKLKSTKGGTQGLEDREVAILRLPPSTYHQSWYPVARIELQPDCKICRMHPNVTPIVCMVQVLDEDGDEQMTAWSLLLAKLELSDRVRKATEELQEEMNTSGDCFRATGIMSGKHSEGK